MPDMSRFGVRAANLYFVAPIHHHMKKQILIVIVVLAALFPQLAIADNLNIPHGYESAYHHLLEQRQRLMDDRATVVRNLTQCESWLVQIDKALIVNTSSSVLLNRQKLLSSRSYLLGWRDKLRGDLAYKDMSLHNVEKDLAWLEGEMKHLACMK